MESSAVLVSTSMCLVIVRFIPGCTWFLFALDTSYWSEDFLLTRCCQSLIHIIPSSSVSWLPTSFAVSLEDDFLLWMQWNPSVLRFTLLLNFNFFRPAAANPGFHFAVYIAWEIWISKPWWMWLYHHPLYVGRGINVQMHQCAEAWSEACAKVVLVWRLVNNLWCHPSNGMHLFGFETGFITCLEFTR